LWRWANTRSAAADLKLDKQAKDASRFWYDPTRPVGAWRSERLSGEPLDVDAVIAEPLPEPRPPLRVVPPPVPLTDDVRVRRARAYLERIPGAVAGANGHTAAFNAISHAMIGFDLTVDQTRDVIAEYNARCVPPWSEAEIEHKLTSIAAQTRRSRGYLLTERPRITDARQAARTAPPVPDELSVDWRADMLQKKDGTYLKRYSNTATCRPFYRIPSGPRCSWKLVLKGGMPPCARCRT
jgi:hypothetical protein